MRLAALLRMTALGIALLCWLDPPSTVAPPAPVTADVAIVRSSRESRPARMGSSETALEASRRLAVALTEELGRQGVVHVHEVSAGAPLPCDAVQPCAIVTEGAAVAIPSDRKGAVSVVLLGEALAPNADVVALVAPPTHRAGQPTARVTLIGHGLVGQTSRVHLLDGGAVVGEASHLWEADGAQVIHVPWWPIGEGRRRLDARVVTDGVEEVTTVDNTLSGPVDIRSERWRVAVVERRPSWAATFVRRAIENDPRFELAARTDVAPRIAVTSVDAALDPERLDETRVVIVGAPDALTGEDVARLDRFVRLRGGAVVLVPDRPMGGPVRALLSHEWREHLQDGPSEAGPLQASEWLIASDPSALDHVWAESGEGPAIVATPSGAGVVLVSGALDAWRHRAGGAYERFWQSTIAGLAQAVPTPVAVSLVSDRVRGHDVRADIRVRTVRGAEAWTAAAEHVCGDTAVPLRLWPSHAAGGFTARVPIDGQRDCRVVVRVAGVGEDSGIVSAPGDESSLRWTPEDVDALAARGGGTVVRDGDVGLIVDAWVATRGAERRPEPRYPMRSWWWLAPFAVSLAGEWWLRRRAGLR